MKLQILSLVTFFVLASIGLYGQDEKKSGMKVSSVGISFGFAGAGVASTNEDYEGLSKAVNNPELFINADDYKRSDYNLGAGGNVNPKIYLGLTPFSKKKGEYRYDRELRFSFGTGSGLRRSFNYYKYDMNRMDTLQSNNGGNVVYADSLIYNRFIYQETFFDFNFGVSFLFKTPFERRFHFTAGVGLEYALAFRSYVRVENYYEESMIYYEPNNKPVFDEEKFDYYNFYDNQFEGTTTTQTTNFSNNMQFVRMFVPLGINFRISKKPQSFFNKVYLFGEMSPGIEVQIVPNDKTYVNPYFGFAMFGFTYRW